jgi:hypothetical protein
MDDDQGREARRRGGGGGRSGRGPGRCAVRATPRASAACARAAGRPRDAQRPQTLPRAPRPARVQLLEARTPLQGLMLSNKFGKPTQVAKLPLT